MSTRSKVMLGTAAVAVLAGTSGVALAADTPQLASRVPSQVTGQVIGSIAAVRPGGSTVRQPGSLTVTVRASRCITDVRAWAYSSAAQPPVSSPVATRKGTVFTLHVPFPRRTATGTWYLANVDANQCGTKGDPWNEEWDGYDSFRVLPPKS